MLTVRRAADSDIPALMDLLVQVDMVHHRGRPDLFRGPATKYSEAELKNLLADGETPIFVCQEENGRVLGHGFCAVCHEGGSVMTSRTEVYIDDICVDEAARGRGVGRALFDHITAWARDLGACRVTLNVWTCNPGALAFYEKLGLVPYKIGMELRL